MTGKRVLVTGCSGQIGQYLSNLLRAEGHEVWGLVSPQGGVHIPGGSEKEWVAKWLPFVKQVPGDLLDQSSLFRALKEVTPEEIYALASITQPYISSLVPELVLNVNAFGMARLLNAAKSVVPEAKIIHLSSDAIFGVAPVPQTIDTPISPRDFYGLSKAIAHMMVKTYRNMGLWAANAILFNAVSPLQTTGVFIHVIDGVNEISQGKADHMDIRNLDARRDWLYAGDVADALTILMRQEKPEDIIICRGESYTVRDLAETAFRLAGIPEWNKYVRVTNTDFDPVWPLAKPEKLLSWGWTPSMDFGELVRFVMYERRELC